MALSYMKMEGCNESTEAERPLEIDPQFTVLIREDQKRNIAMHLTGQQSVTYIYYVGSGIIMQ